MSSEPLHVMVSGAAGQIGYALLPLLANGCAFGDRKVFLHLLDITPAMTALGGVKMEPVCSLVFVDICADLAPG